MPGKMCPISAGVCVSEFHHFWCFYMSVCHRFKGVCSWPFATLISPRTTLRFYLSLSFYVQFLSMNIHAVLSRDSWYLYMHILNFIFAPTHKIYWEAFLGEVLYGLWGSNAPWFMCWFRHYINSSCVYVISSHPSFLLSLCYLSYLFTSLLVCFLTYLSTSRIDPFRFQAGCHRRRPNLALVFGLILCYSIFWYGCMFALVVFVFVFRY